MGTGILICGLNGAGKSTLGKALAEKLHFYFIDNEDLYFPKTDPLYLYASPRPRHEVERILLREIRTHENFVFTSVKGDYGKAVCSYFDYIVWIIAPGEIRLQRVKNRSFQKFGDRMLPGGDLHEPEERFFDFVKYRKDDSIEEWLKSMSCPILRLDGKNPVEDNVKAVMEVLQGQHIVCASVFPASI